ncbi:hypothetical protein TYRP_008841 [Tyrophagus putrescentiae]|nr:hypothetical protein TYRP_008841 [Tyrophagus putrescentiae]
MRAMVISHKGLIWIYGSSSRGGRGRSVDKEAAKAARENELTLAVVFGGADFASSSVRLPAQFSAVS